MSEHPLINILIVDRSSSSADRIVQTLRDSGYTVQEVITDKDEEIHDCIEYRPIDLIIIHPGSDSPGIGQIRERVIAADQDIPLIVALDDIGHQPPLTYLRAGADNFFELKEPDHLSLAVRKELRHLDLRKQVHSQEIRLDECESRSRALLQNSQDGIAYIHEGVHIYANPAYRELFGYASEEEIEGTPLMEVILPEDRDRLKRLLRQATKTGKPLEPVELSGIDSKHKRFSIYMRCIPTRMNEEPCLQILIQNTVQQRDFEEKLSQAVQFDELTGLYNRKFFTQYLNRLCSAKEPPEGAVFYILMTDYRSISEHLGLEAVDQMLIELADLVKDMVSENDTVAHFSDAVFTIYTSNTSNKEAVQLGDRLCDTIRNHDTHVAQKLVNTSCSIGICMLQESHKNASQVLFHADRACETARQMGGNQVQLYEPPSTVTGLVREEEHRLLGQIKSAVVEERLHLLYQPIANFQGEAVERYKAYLRIVDENQQPLSLNVLAPVAENHNLMGQLDKWVIVRCFEMLAEQRQHGKGTPILFIRISNNSLADEKFSAWLNDRLKEAELPGNVLVVEVPEDAAEKYFKETKQLKQELKKLDCAFALSHFGAKANSERILQNLIPDYIKLDISLIEKLAKARDDASRKAMNVIVEKAQEIEARIIAAEVSSASQMASMWQFGVTLVQGDMVEEASSKMDFDFEQFAG